MLKGWEKQEQSLLFYDTLTHQHILFTFYSNSKGGIEKYIINYSLH